MFITAVPITKLFAWGEGDSGGHVLRFDVVTGVEALSRCVHESAASDILVFVARCCFFLKLGLSFELWRVSQATCCFFLKQQRVLGPLCHASFHIMSVV